MADGQFTGSALPDDREEKLAQELAKGASQAEAYISAGYNAKNNNVAAVNCNRLLKRKPEISARTEELRQIARNEVKVAEFKGDVETLTRMYLEDREFAKQCRQPGAMVSASSGIAKLYKLGGDKPPGESDNPVHHVHTIKRVIVHADNRDR